MKRYFYLAVAMLATCFLGTPVCLAQTSSGEISGRVVDASGAVIPGASVTLTNQATGEQRATSTGTDGLFSFPSIQPAAYSVLVKSQGFKELSKRDLNLSASQRLSAGNLKLEIGSATETVNVEAAPTPVQTESGERSALLDSHELASLSTPGRDVLALVRLLPGVVKDGEGASQLGTESAGSVSGTREVSNNISVDNGLKSTTTKGDIRVDANSQPGTKLNYDLTYLSSAGTMATWGSKTYSTLAAFSATLQGKLDLTELGEQLVGVVDETMQPSHVSLWLRQPERQTRENLKHKEPV